jgi:hypothetical protein
MFPHYIISKRNVLGKYVTVWQLGDYHYEIEFTGGEVIDLPNTSCDDALRIMQRHMEVAGVT